MAHKGTMLLNTWLKIGVLGLSFALGMNAQLRVSPADALKAAVKQPKPEYSPIARQMKITGDVDVEIFVGLDGNTEEVRVMSGNALLTPAVVNALKKWKFTPFTVDGESSKAIVILRFNFRP
jgi:protein TonB